MLPTVRGMLPEASLNVRLLVEGQSIDHTIDWIHSSDLSDPTPFLEAGQVLLTTGTQFGDYATQDHFDAYVHRLAVRGVVAIGFGTEVVRSGTPPELITACEVFGLPLIEVPYRTPFIALVRWAADLIARAERERDNWSLSAQRAISLAAVGQHSLAGVLTVLATQLGCRVAIFEPDGAFNAVLSPSSFTPSELSRLSSEATRLFRAQRRSADSTILDGQRVTVQTLGSGGRLSGVLMLVGATLEDSAAKAVLVSAIALIEISFEESRIRGGSLMPLHEELFSLLVSGQSEIVLRALPTLPRTDLRLVLCNCERQSQWFIDAMEHPGSHLGFRPFLAPYANQFVALVSSTKWQPLKTFLLDHAVAAGVSAAGDIAHLTTLLAQARHALSRGLAEGGGITEFAEVSDSAFLEIVSGQPMIDLAHARLDALLDDAHGCESLEDTFVWLAHRGGWDSAAKQLGIHRHSLKLRVEAVAQSLSMSLDSFSDRAQLWSMLQSLDFGARQPRARSLPR